MSDELLIEHVPPTNGKNCCIQARRLNKIDTEQAAISSLLSDLLRSKTQTNEILADLTGAIAKVDGKIGGVCPDNPLEFTGLTGAVQRIANRQMEWEREAKSIRPRLQSIEDAGEITKTHSLDELVGRVHAAEARAEKQAEELRAKAEKELDAKRTEDAERARFKRNVMLKVVAGLTSAGGLVWLARVLEVLK